MNIPKPAHAVLWPVNMGHYGQNRFSLQETFAQLRRYSRNVTFVSYHWRPSGNFVFIDSGASARQTALEAGEEVTGLDCLIRTLSDLRRVNQAVPQQAYTTRGGSVILSTSAGDKKLIHVALSQDVGAPIQCTRAIGAGVETLAWPTTRDIVCLQDRPENNGSVGQATTMALKICRQSHPDIYGTGRALGVVRDILEDRKLRCG